ncbi:MAG: hypothetical protein CSA97_02340 [Bacteroidetes bacterium]|nr:MAG: hypothetical protein CSA97_02340 [Bacteroidota bacterium]
MPDLPVAEGAIEPTVDTTSHNYLARFAEMNLMEWEPHGGRFCAEVPTLDTLAAAMADVPEDEERFGPLFPFPPAEMDKEVAAWSMPIAGVHTMRWVIPTYEELAMVFTSADGGQISFVDGLAYQLREIEGYMHALRYEFVNRAGLEIRSRLVADTLSLDSVRSEAFWNAPMDEVVRCFPALGCSDTESDPRMVYGRGEGGSCWSSTPSGRSAMSANFSITLADVYEVDRTYGLCIRPFARGGF